VVGVRSTVPKYASSDTVALKMQLAMKMVGGTASVSSGSDHETNRGECRRPPAEAAEREAPRLAVSGWCGVGQLETGERSTVGQWRGLRWVMVRAERPGGRGWGHDWALGRESMWVRRKNDSGKDFLEDGNVRLSRPGFERIVVNVAMVQDDEEVFMAVRGENGKASS
jgi:hypothetical protein